VAFGAGSLPPYQKSYLIDEIYLAGSWNNFVVREVVLLE
jgi:hypothetical protein